jgi:ribosomal protein S27E
MIIITGINIKKAVIFLRFVDYKCNDCNAVDEYVINSNDANKIKCSKCGSLNTVRVFAPINFKASASSGQDCGCDSSSCTTPSKSCSGSSCSTCSGCH